MSQKSLPKEYKNISLIEDTEVREILSRVINRLMSLLRKTKQYQFDIKTKNKVELFLTYLETKCKSLDDLTKWARWLITYGTNISSLLQNILTKVGFTSQETDINKRDVFIEHLTKMIEDTTLLVTTYPYLFSSHHLNIRSLLTNILDKSTFVLDTSLERLLPDILNVSNYVHDLYVIRPFQYDEEVSQTLLNYLKVLQKKINHIDLLTLYEKVHNG
jgi:hypothetical protein